MAVSFLTACSIIWNRRGELAGLKWSCIDFDSNTIKVEEQATYTGMSKILKTESSYREIAIEPSALEELNKLTHDKPYVFMVLFKYGELTSKDNGKCTQHLR